MASITVYTTNACAYCVQVKRLLDKRGLTFDEINLARDPEGRTALIEKTGRMSFPQVLIGDTVVGGFEETVRAERSGQLAQLLAEAA
ncbi:glutaredoxin family protein [Paraconexibacter sp.]|uniref:glutaredoxin family protein n=1 Tax=Paraconexibacter sp. TaxID=2949640 RepID=UPI0035626980